MTINKSLISIAAATLLAASFVGCSSDDSSTAPAPAPTPASVSGVAVDGYIINATVKGTYIDDANASQTVTYDRTVSSTNVVTGAKTLGNATYTINDANSTLSIRSKQLTGTVAPAIGTDNVSIDATYIDVDGSGDYNATVDSAANTLILNAPQGFGPITLVSEMVFKEATVVAEYARSNAAKDDVNQTVIDNAATKIAAALNLSIDDAKNVDPVTKPEYAFTNAMLASNIAGLGALADALVAANTPSTSLAATFTNLVAAEPANATFGIVKANVDSGTITTANVGTFNADLTRAANGSPVLNTPSTSAFARVTAITNGTLVNTGDKLLMSAPIAGVTFDATAATDVNSTGTVDLLIQVSQPTAAMDTTAKASALTIKVSDVGVNLVAGSAPTLDLNTTLSKISYEWMNADSNSTNYITNSSIDANASGINLSGLVTTAGSIDVAGIINAVDANVSATSHVSAMATALTTNIANVKVILVDAAGVLTYVDGANGNQVAWAQASIAGTNGVITGSGKVLLNLQADARGAATGANGAPTISAANTKVNYADTAKDSNTTYTVVTTTETGELNNSITVTGLPTWVTVTNATKVNQTADNDTVDFNLTTDSNLTIGDTNTTAKWSVTDEFGKTTAGTSDANISYFFNAIPTISVASNAGLTNWTKVTATHYTVDMNASKVSGSIVLTVGSMMGETNSTADMKYTDLNTSVTRVTDLNSTTGVGSMTLTDINASTQPSDMNVTLIETAGGNTPVVVDFNTSI